MPTTTTLCGDFARAARDEHARTPELAVCFFRRFSRVDWRGVFFRATLGRLDVSGVVVVVARRLLDWWYGPPRLRNQLGI